MRYTARARRFGPSSLPSRPPPPGGPPVPALWWRRSAHEGGECLAGRSAAGGFVPCQVGADCSGEPGDCLAGGLVADAIGKPGAGDAGGSHVGGGADGGQAFLRSEEHTSELQSQFQLVCRLLLEKKKK